MKNAELPNRHPPQSRLRTRSPWALLRAQGPESPRVKRPTTFHLWDETRFALHNAQWELGMNLSEIGEAAIRQYLEGEGITVAEPGTGAVRRRRRKKVNGVVRG